MIQATRFWGNNSTSFAISKNNWWDFCQTVNSLKDSILPIFLHYFPISLHPYVPNPCISAPQASQSLIHQVSDSDRVSTGSFSFSLKSQSLIHQVSDSDSNKQQVISWFYLLSQSLIHQVSDSDNMNDTKRLWLQKSLNPLFIRSQIQIWITWMIM